MPVFQSSDPTVPAAEGDHATSGTGLVGASASGMGVHGTDDSPRGGTIKPRFGSGVWGESTNGYGVFGASDNNVGVTGQSANSDGVRAQTGGRALFEGGPMVGFGLFGVLTAAPDTVRVFQNSGAGVAGVSTANWGVLVVSSVDAGVEGQSPIVGVRGTTGVGSGVGVGVEGSGQTGLNGVGTQFGARGAVVSPGDTTAASGFLAGRDPVFNEAAGVYGESSRTGVFGNSDAVAGTGVHGRGGGGGGFGVRCSRSPKAAV